MRILPLIVALTTLLTVSKAQQPLTISQITYLSKSEFRTAHLLFDNNVNTFWFGGWPGAKTQYPLKISVTLSRVATLKSIKVYDGTGVPNLKITAQGEQQSLLLTKYNSWTTIDFPVSTKTVDFEISEALGDKMIGEIIFVEETSTVPPVVPPPPVSVDPVVTIPPTPPNIIINYRLDDEWSRFGINTFHWVPDSLTDFFATSRQYQYAWWSFRPGGRMKVQPAFGGNMNLDDYLRVGKEKGQLRIPAINSKPEWLAGVNKRADFDYEPMYDEGKESFSSDPAAYLQWSQYAYQYGVRYGKNVYPKDVVKIDTVSRWNGDANAPLSGLNLGIADSLWIEPGNEPNTWWKPQYGQHTPEQAMASYTAFFDGAEKSLCGRCGIINADNRVKCIYPALADLNVPYLQKSLDWAKQHRKDKIIPGYGFGVHWYSNEGNFGVYDMTRQKVNMTKVGRSPESDSLYERLRLVVKWRDTNLPGKIIHFSEYGYDTDQRSPQRAPQVGKWSPEEVQAIWSIRGFLEARRAGVDMFYIYNSINTLGEQNGGLFTTCGLAYGEHPANPADKFKKKKSWYIVRDFVVQLKGLRYVQDLSTDRVRMMVFKGSNKSALVCWIPTQNDSIFTMSIAGKQVSITESPQFFWIQ